MADIGRTLIPFPLFFLMGIFLTELHISLAISFPPLDKIKPSVSAEVQQITVLGLIQRLLLNRSSEFQIVIDPTLGPSNRTTFLLESIENNMIKVTGNTGVAASLGLHHYLKYWAGCHFSWSGNQIKLPPLLPKVSSPVKITTHDQFHYYQNMCTSSYSFVWWKWERWEKEIDWMALNGINLPLAQTGQEALWTRVYKKLGFSENDLSSFFTGPAFLAWNRMGNIDGWAGPLSSTWQENQLQLQHRILKRMRSFGMISVLPAFSGHVPRTINTIFPKANVSRQRQWKEFNETYTYSYLLDPKDPLFRKIGNLFLLEMIKEFNGTNHIYSCDVFNELPPKSADLHYLRSIGKAIFTALTSVDKDAVWLMQGWLFNYAYWTHARVRAFVTSVPIGKMIILDAPAELFPRYKSFKSFYGQPFIWCMVHNYGGAHGFYGIVERINTGPFLARQFPHSTMVGIGFAPEGIEQNYAIYQFLNEMTWRPSPVSIKKWFEDYSVQRYGGNNNNVTYAWRMISKHIYNCTDLHRHHGRYIIVRRPQMYMIPVLFYPPNVIFDVWQSMLFGSHQFETIDTFRYDLVDVTREALQTLGNQIYVDIVESFHEKNSTSLRISGEKMQTLLKDLETLLATNVHFLLGRWLEDAKACANTRKERNMLEYNARLQLTLWGQTELIADYARKQWSGMFSHYYSKRWKLFVEMLQGFLSSKMPFLTSIYNKKVLTNVEEPFLLDRSSFTTVPFGDSVEVSTKLYEKWSQQIDYPILNKLRRKYIKVRSYRELKSSTFRIVINPE